MNIWFRTADAARALALPPAVIETLVRSGVLKTVEHEGADVVSAQDIEALLRDTLLRLYRAEAVATEVEVDIPTSDDVVEITEPAKDDPLITRSIAEFQAASDDARANQRIAPRYRPRRQLGGTFRTLKFSVLQLSATGLRVRHEETLRPGDEARLALSLQKPARTFVVRARVVWTSIAQRGSGPSFCISGVRVVDQSEQMREAIDLLLAQRELEPESGSARSATPAGITGLSDEEVASIIRAARLLTSDPVEAGRWYTRAKFALADESVRAAAPSRPRDREEALAVWEYLKRSIDLRAVAGVLSWIRQTRSAAV